MLRSLPVRLVFLLLAATSFAVHGRAQCLDWRAFPLAGNETSGGMSAVQLFDDGSGMALYLGGSNMRAPTDPYRIVSLLRWNGATFSELPGNLTGFVFALAVHDDGTGNALYVAGHSLSAGGVSMGTMCRWNGVAWSAVGSTFGGGVVFSLLSYDDGTGSALFAGGSYNSIGGVPSKNVARWNGTQWTDIAASDSLLPALDITSLVGFDDGTGPALYAGSTQAWAYNFFRYHAGAWTHVSSPNLTAWSVQSMTVGDMGDGPACFVSTDGSNPDPFGVRVWTGGQLQLLGAQGTGIIGTLKVADVGSGPLLYATRFNTSGGPAMNVWDGVQWTVYSGTVIPGCNGNIAGSGARLLEVFDWGQGPRLVGGTVHTGTQGWNGQSLAEWTGTQWSPLGPSKRGFTDEIRALHVYDDGAGPALYAGGAACYVDSTRIQGLARWNGTEWSSVFPGLAPGVEVIQALTTHVTPTGPYLVYGTAEGSIRYLNGPSYFTAIFPNGPRPVFALQSFGGDLYVGGTFTTLGSTLTPNIGRITASGPALVGQNGLAGANGAVNALTLFDDGTGSALYAGGSFQSASGISLSRVGKWDGTQWSPLSSGLNGLCDALVAFDDGSGPALYAAGTFTTAGGAPASCVARWRNGSWSALGAGLNAQVLSLGSFDDGSGPRLYAGGNFTASGSTPIQRVAKWDGVKWSALGGGVDGTVWALQSFDDGTGAGPQLFAGGSFHRAASTFSQSIASWRGCDGPVSRFCFGDGTVASCPCANQGLSSRGCNNSFSTGGVRMNASGTTFPDSISFYLSGLIPGTASLLFQGREALSEPISFGDGLLCVSGNLLRLKVAFSPAGTLGFPLVGDPSISATSASLGDPITAGQVRTYQAWYRDSGTYCTTATSNLSNAVRIEW